MCCGHRHVGRPRPFRSALGPCVSAAHAPPGAVGDVGARGTVLSAREGGCCLSASHTSPFTALALTLP